MDAQTLEELLQWTLESIGQMDDEERSEACLDESDWAEDLRADSFRDSGLMTRDNGLILNLKSGLKFQLTITEVN